MPPTAGGCTSETTILKRSTAASAWCGRKGGSSVCHIIKRAPDTKPLSPIFLPDALGAMDRAFLRPPLVVRAAMERMQLEIESKQDETLVKHWLDFACQRAASAAQTGSTDKCSPEPEDETTDALGAKVAALYAELSNPSAAKFKAALAKRGIRVPDAFVRQLVGEQGDQQLFAPPPRFTGKVVAQHMDERWAADVIDFQSKTAKGVRPCSC